MSFSRAKLPWLFIIFVCGIGEYGFAQPIAGTPGWLLRAIDSAETINSLESHNNAFPFDAASAEDRRVDVINYQDDSRFTDSIPWTDTFSTVTLNDDFVVRGIADVTIPAGEWGVGWGSDDGGQLQIPGIEFVTRHNTRGEHQPSDQLIFDGNRAYNITWGSFSLETPLETTVNVSMWERGGGDNFDVFYINLSEQYGIEADELKNTDAARPAHQNDWDLLGAGDFSVVDKQGDWNVRFPTNVPRIVVPVAPGDRINSRAENVEKEALGDAQPGLLHHWYGRGNPGSLDGVQEFYALGVGPLEEPDVAAFNPENTWWTGNQPALTSGTTRAPKYPIEIIDQMRLDGGTFNGHDNSNYTTVVSGEIRFPRDGEYIFTDGVDDLTVLAIDVDRSGEIEDEEILINDNAWTNINREANNGGFPNDYVPVTIDVPEDGNCDDFENASNLCWYRIDAMFAEGGGADAGILYWNENPNVQFPRENGDRRVIANDDLPELAIPEDHLRAPGGIVVTAADLVADLNGSFTYEFDVHADGTHDSIEVDRNLDVGTTFLNLNGATIDIIASGDISSLGEIEILTADVLAGEVTVNLPAGVTADISRLATEGVINFGSPVPDSFDCNLDLMVDISDANCTDNVMLDEFLKIHHTVRGDFDGIGGVHFSDFITLATNFGLSGEYTDGDADKDGAVQFGDFVIVAANFGQGGNFGAVPVPEPNTWFLLATAGGLLRTIRRREAN